MEKSINQATTTSPKTVNQVVCFRNKNVKISPRKLRLVANIVKKLSPQSALEHLSVTNSKSAADKVHSKR